MPLYKGFLPRQTPGVYTLNPRFDPKLVRKCGIRQHFSDTFEMVIDRVGEDSQEMSSHRHVVWRDHGRGYRDRKWCCLGGEVWFRRDWDVGTIGKPDFCSRTYILTVVVWYPMGRWLDIWTISAGFLEAGETSCRSAVVTLQSSLILTFR